MDCLRFLVFFVTLWFVEATVLPVAYSSGPVKTADCIAKPPDYIGKPTDCIGKPVVDPPKPENCIGNVGGCQVKPVIGPLPPVILPLPPVIKPLPPVYVPKPEPPIYVPLPPVIKPMPPVIIPKPEPPIYYPLPPVIKPMPPIIVPKPEPPIYVPLPPVIKPCPPTPPKDPVPPTLPCYPSTKRSKPPKTAPPTPPQSTPPTPPKSTPPTPPQSTPPTPPKSTPPTPPQSTPPTPPQSTPPTPPKSTPPTPPQSTPPTPPQSTPPTPPQPTPPTPPKSTPPTPPQSTPPTPPQSTPPSTSCTQTTQKYTSPMTTTTTTTTTTSTTTKATTTTPAPTKPSCTGPHEVYSECGNNACQKNCETYDLHLLCKPICTPGCICEDGYIRNKNGKCVLPEDCENRQCPKNEMYTQCVCPCCERCSNLGRNPVCNFLVCNPGCDCKPGFFRNSKNECVPPAECDCPNNEVLDLCYTNCPPDTCDSIGKMFKCAAPNPNNCKPACKCKTNYRRDSNGVCIPIEKCPSLPCNGDNEVYDPCPSNCLDERCASLYDPLACPANVRLECFPQCVCRPGYLRDDNGKCIAKSQCKEYCTDPNAVFNPCGDVCPATCLNYGKPTACAPGCLPPGGCVCKPGYVKNANGKCVLPTECPKCGPNEVYNCGSACDTTCATLGDACPIVNIKCVEQCYCVDGYARNAQNVCVPIKQCPPKFACTGKNQQYNQCPVNCPPEETCDSYLSGIVVDCANGPETRFCVPRCECKPGYIRNGPGGDCIKPNQCCPDPNAEIVSCPNPCPGGTCLSPTFANCKAPCKIRGCQCKQGYVKNKDGKCILLSECPKPCTGVNEEWQDCGTACPRTCENLYTKFACIERCVPGCFCKENLVRKNGICVRPEECACGDYETFSDCAPNVQQTCATLNKPVCKDCKPGCVCISGYVRDCHAGKCVPISSCSYY